MAAASHRNAARGLISAFCLGAWLALWPSAVRAEAAAAGRFLLLSDIHFDPVADPRLVDRLAAAPPAGWPGILDSAADLRLAGYGADTNWPLLRSALDAAKAAVPRPAFVLITGDFLAHNFRARFAAAARDRSDAAFRSFVAKTMQFLAGEIAAVFPDTPVLPALGNNDGICGDFELQPNGPFLADMLPVVRSLGDGGELALGPAWTSYGNYRATLTALPRVRIVFANTLFWARRYRDACGAPGGPDPGKATLDWLAGELASAAAAHRRVWLVYHVPPGIDGFATWRQGSCPGDILAMWTDGYARAYGELLRRYADTVAASFAGHTHMDDFRLLGEGPDKFAFTLINPAVSPIFGQNPAFRIVDYDTAGGILDQTTYELANLAEAGAAAPPEWRAEYTFTREWGLPRIDTANLERLSETIGDDPARRARWQTLFVVSSPVYWQRAADAGSSATAAVRAAYCATGHAGVAGFARCDCGER